MDHQDISAFREDFCYDQVNKYDNKFTLIFLERFTWFFITQRISISTAREQALKCMVPGSFLAEARRQGNWEAVEPND